MKRKLCFLLLVLSIAPLFSQDYRLFTNFQSTPGNNVFLTDGAVYRTARFSNPISTAQPIIAPGSIASQSGLTRLWQNVDGINIGEPAYFEFYNNSLPPFIPSYVYTAINQPIQNSKYYIFKIKTDQDADTFGIMMEFGGIPYAYTDVNENVLGQTQVNTPITVTIRSDYDVAEGLYYYIKYRHSSDPANEYRWGQFSFVNASSRLGNFTIPGFPTPGTVSYQVIGKCKPITAFTNDDYTRSIYDVVSPGEMQQYEVKSYDDETVPTTFSVNMAGQTVSADGVYLDLFTNSINAYCKMNPIGNDLYSITVPTLKNSKLSFKFINGSSGRENLESSSCLTGFRNYFVKDVASSTPVYCYESCTDSCNSNGGNVDITFRVKIPDSSVDDEVFMETNVAFSPVPMTFVGNDVYQVTMSLIPNTNVIYRFKRGFTEINRKICSVENNNQLYRFLRVPTSNQQLNTVCFNECGDCDATPIATATLRVNMTGQTLANTGVYVAGNFNNWSTTANPMTFVGNGIYETDVTLEANQFMEYKFINGNTYEVLPNDCFFTTAEGNRYEFIYQDFELTPPCFGDCVEVCGTANATVNVTFRVNMTGQIISSNGVKLAGTFNGFSTTATPMFPVGNNIYEVQVSLPINSEFQYKFVNGGAFEIVPTSCGFLDLNNNYNRKVVVATQDIVLPTVCLNQCETSCFSSPQQVTFTVDMANQTVSTNGVFLSGSFNNWSTTANPMTNISGSLYQTTLTLPSNILYEYKFVNGTQFESVPEVCGANDGNFNVNRVVVVQNQSLSLPTVCFATCSECNVTPNTVDVTFRVNMTGQVISPNGVKLAGSFNGFSTTATPMASVGNGIYQVTLPLVVGSFQTFKYVNGSQFELIDASCGVLGSQTVFDRFVNVPATATTLDLVCFNSCTNTCTVCEAPTEPIVSNITSNSILLSWVAPIPAPSNGYEVFFNTSGLAPTSATSPSETTLNSAIGINSLLPNTQYFFWVRSNCGNSVSDWIQSTTNPITIPFFGCNSADYGLYPIATYTPSCSGTPEVIVNNAWPGEYSNVNVIANKQYTFSSSVNSDYITITNATGTQLLLAGQSPLVWFSANYSGVIRYYLHSNAQCGSSNANRVRRILCSNSSPVLSAVLFNVNMSNQAVSPEGVKVAGNFNNWSTTANVLNTTGNGIYTGSITIPLGTVLEYKFVNGSTYEIVPSTCTFNDGNGNFNRRYYVNLPGFNSIPLVCFNECANCQPLSNSDFETNAVRVYPNPIAFGQSLTIDLTAEDWVYLYDVTGKWIAKKYITPNDKQWSMDQVAAGVYFLKSSFGTVKILIQ